MSANASTWFGRPALKTIDSRSTMTAADVDNDDVDDG